MNTSMFEHSPTRGTATFKYSPQPRPLATFSRRVWNSAFPSLVHMFTSPSPPNHTTAHLISGSRTRTDWYHHDRTYCKNLRMRQYGYTSGHTEVYTYQVCRVEYCSEQIQEFCIRLGIESRGGEGKKSRGISKVIVCVWSTKWLPVFWAWLIHVRVKFWAVYWCIA